MRAIRLGQNPGGYIEAGVRQGLLLRKDIPTLKGAAMQTPLERSVTNLSPEEALNVFDLSSPEERRRLAPLVMNKISGASAEPWKWSRASRAKAAALFGINPVSGLHR